MAEIGGVRFVNDSKATNIESARRAIESFGDGVVAIIGGRFKGGDFRDLLRAARSQRRRASVAIGEAGPLVREALGIGVAVHEAAPCRRRCGRAFALGVAGQTVVLGAGVRELRHVSRLRGARTRVQGGGEEFGGVERAGASECSGAVRARSDARTSEHVTRELSSHQSVDAVKNLPLGTQAAPVCEVGVFARGRLMTADRSRGLSGLGEPPTAQAICRHQSRDL